MEAAVILRNIIFIGGPPRSGTTFAVKSLNLHPGFVAAIDDHVYECWGLYRYRDRVGLVHDLRTRPVSPAEAQNALLNHLVADGRLVGAAPSGKTSAYPLARKADPSSPGPVRSLLDQDLPRHDIPLETFSGAWRLCLKSPEISFVLPHLANHFPDAKFVLVYRPLIEIAESMFRIGNLVSRFPVFHKRWMLEKENSGEWIPPPGVPAEWRGLWPSASGFQRCVVYAASYLRGLLQGIGEVARDRCFVYDHASLRKSPGRIFQQLAEFLLVEASGFQMAEAQLKTGLPLIPAQAEKEYAEMEREMALNQLMQQMESVRASIHPVAKTGA
jgi:hypothetical protein